MAETHKKFSLKRNWWKILLGLIAAATIGLLVFFAIKLKPAYDFVQQNFTAEKIDEKSLNTEPFILYISAIDTRDNDLPEKARSDLNILAVVNPSTKQATLINIPRDYYVNLPEINQMDKLTHAGDIGGVNLSKKTIEELLDIKIDRTIRVNFYALEGVVNAIDGIEINSDQNQTYSCYWDRQCIVNPGKNTLDGHCAVAFARERLSYREGDLKRAKNQEAVIKAIFEKLAQDKSYLFNYEKILDGLNGTFDTDISKDEIIEFMSLITNGWQITEQNLAPAGSGYEYTYTFPNEKKFVFYQNPDSINQIKSKISEIKPQNK